MIISYSLNEKMKNINWKEFLRHINQWINKYINVTRFQLDVLTVGEENSKKFIVKIIFG